MKRVFRKQTTAGCSKDLETNYGISATVPDGSLTVRQIIDRFASGTLSDIDFKKDLMYSEDLPDLRGLDITELTEMRKQARQDVKDLTDEIQSRKNDALSPVAPSPTDEPKDTEP